MNNSLVDKNRNTVLIGWLFFISVILTLLVPSFQAPDEINHFGRALGLADGQFFAKGGTIEVDSTFTQIFSMQSEFNFQYDFKNTRVLQHHLENLPWSHQTNLLNLPNTAVYFPLVYVPQAIGVLIAKLFGSSPYTTYQAARLSTIVISFLLLLCANHIRTIPPLVIMLLGLPMSLFLTASTSPDGVSLALTTLAAALFLKIYHQQSQEGHLKTACLLAVVIFAIITARINTFPILLLFPFLALYRKLSVKQAAAVFSTTFLLALSWVVYAFKSIVADGDFFVNSGMTAGQKAAYYLQNPSSLVKIFADTLFHPDVNHGYWTQFIGVLGWLDTPLVRGYYFIFSALLVVGMIIYYNKDKGLLVLSIFFLLIINLLTHFILLVSWTNLNDLTIQGVQGRYFIPIFILAAYLCSDNGAHIFTKNRITAKLKLWLPFVFIFLSGIALVNAVTNRYLLN